MKPNAKPVYTVGRWEGDTWIVLKDGKPFGVSHAKKEYAKNEAMHYANGPRTFNQFWDDMIAKPALPKGPQNMTKDELDLCREGLRYVVNHDDYLRAVVYKYGCVFNEHGKVK